MKIFYILQDEFKNLYSKDFISKYADIELKTEKRFYEYTIGRYLVKTVAKNVYGISDTDIITLENGKPVFKNSKLCFNISHSKNVIIACFDEFPCGIDIEFIKNRNLEKFSSYYNEQFRTLEEFYNFWTFKEASYKIGAEINDKYFCKLENQYFVTIVSGNKIGNITFQNVLKCEILLL